MLLRPQSPFLPFACFSIGFGTGIASLLFTISPFGKVGGVLMSACIGAVLALAMAAVPRFVSCVERRHHPRGGCGSLRRR